MHVGGDIYVSARDSRSAPPEDYVPTIIPRLRAMKSCMLNSYTKDRDIRFSSCYLLWKPYIANNRRGPKLCGCAKGEW